MKYLLILGLIFAGLFTDPEPDLHKGLLAWYTFDHCDARDYSGNEWHGKMRGDIACWCGIDDDGLLFDGSDDYLEFEGQLNRYFNTSDFTISFYFKPHRYHVFRQSMLSKREFCDEYNMMDILLDRQLHIIDADVHETPRKDYPNISPDMEGTGWQHFALVREGVRAFTYVNGALRHKGIRCSGVDITNEAVLNFGNSPCVAEGAAKRFRGILDELRIYDRALSEAEITAIYYLTPIENAESDCYSYIPDFLDKDYPFHKETTYLCQTF